MLGGFLGAGKTTAVVWIARNLMAQGKRVGLIANDQSVGLVDTARMRAAGVPVEEITGGCFCCKFNSLVEAAAALERDGAPDVLIAEPVGSCTDIKATVSYPLRELYPGRFSMAPLAVLVDPGRCARILGATQSGPTFSEKVAYVYRKQLEEAQIIAINKIDAADPSLLELLKRTLKREFPAAAILEISAGDGTGMEALMRRLLGGELSAAEAMQLDYDLYAEGEALLGWYNARHLIASPTELDGNQLSMGLAQDIRERLASGGVEIAHLKLVLAPDEGPDMASVSLTGAGEAAKATHHLDAPLSRGTLLINLRAEADPERLRTAVEAAMAARSGITFKQADQAAFRPGRPVPTHRVTSPGQALSLPPRPE